jgi:hypothetical protein
MGKPAKPGRSLPRQPAALGGERHARASFGRAAIVLEQKPAVDQFDVKAAALHRLDGAGDLTMRRAALSGSASGRASGYFINVVSMSYGRDAMPFPARSSACASVHLRPVPVLR